MLKFTHKPVPLNIYVVSNRQHVDLKQVTRFQNSLAAITYARATNNFAFHVYTKPEGGLLYDRLYPAKTHFGQTLADALANHYTKEQKLSA